MISNSPLGCNFPVGVAGFDSLWELACQACRGERLLCLLRPVRRLGAGVCSVVVAAGCDDSAPPALSLIDADHGDCGVAALPTLILGQRRPRATLAAEGRPYHPYPAHTNADDLRAH